jgi:hypothetical protein
MMGYLDDAWMGLRSTLEITPTEQKQASRRHTQIRDHVRSGIAVRTDFLTGSYIRHTKTKKLKDVDIFVVVDDQGTDAGLRDLSAHGALGELQHLLAERWPSATIGRRACTIDFGTDEEVTSFDVVLAFDRTDGGFDLPDTTTGGWIASDPRVHADQATAKNKACDEKWKPFVKMVKGWNREWDKPVRPSFLLEVIALELVREPFGTWGDELITFFDNAAERIGDSWPDPAGLGPDVNSSMNSAEAAVAAGRLREARVIAEHASDLADAGKERASVEEYRKLFGRRMPRPRSSS